MAENQDREENQNVTENVNVLEAENQPETGTVPENDARSSGEEHAEHDNSYGDPGFHPDPYSPSVGFDTATTSLDPTRIETATTGLHTAPINPAHTEIAPTHTFATPIDPAHTETNDIQTPLPPSYDIHTPPPSAKRTQPDESEPRQPDESTSNRGGNRLDLPPFDSIKIAKDQQVSKWLRSPYTDPSRAQKKVEVDEQYTTFMNDLNLL
ncbi:hypothetical protein LWI28_015979 [Acer negundo]|uniref:Uncharacterized protein n=1 Tax=Acer negundo TaxID=4023 RepID=A0AAD5NLV5_ACENE|nr:hypothetical protein LWI28_015979 [Acer negundo]